MNEEPVTLDGISRHLRRIETRLVTMGDHIGADLKFADRVHVNLGKTTSVSIDSPQVSIARILSKLEHFGAAHGDIPVWMGSKHLFTLHLDNK